jgi:sigma-E factor negative regulatory protein RseB
MIALILLGACAIALTLRQGQPGRLAASQPDATDPPSSGSGGAAALTASGQLAERLMTQATTAAGDTAYSGVQVSNWWGPSGLSSSSLDVWHRPGDGIVAQAVAAPSDAPGIQLPWFGSGDPVSTMTMSGRQLSLLRQNYQLKYAGPGSACGRSADVISVVGMNGKLVARFWLDSRTKLPLRREVFDSNAHLISDIKLVDLKLGVGALAGMPAAEAQPWTRRLDGDALRALRRAGWPVPQRLAGLMRLFAVSEGANADGPVVDASYSDGLSVISLFVQRGSLPGTLQGWQQVAIDGHHAYTSETDERTIAWSSGGFVFTMIADAPPATVDQAVTALAGSGSASFWTRIGRGFRRLASLANLFR